MSWSTPRQLPDGSWRSTWTGQRRSLRQVAADVRNYVQGEILDTVFIVSPTVLVWDPTPAEVQERELAELARLKAKYPNA